MGKSSTAPMGYWYSLGLHFGLCIGPIDALRAIVAGGKAAWSGNQTTSGDIVINQPELFGGEKNEGGINGTLTVMMGEATQAPNAYLVAQLGTPMPAFRGLCTGVFKGFITANNKYIKRWSFQASKWTAGWRTPVWQASLCKVDEGMNAAHLIYRCITDPVTGLGKQDSALDLTRMLAAAQTLHDEGFGVCFRWSRSAVLSDFIGMVANHVGGTFADDPATGKQYLKLFRDDYDIDTVPVLDESSIIELTSFEQPALAGSVNEVTVTYHDALTNKDANVTVQNLANITAQGRIVNQAASYPGLWNADLAMRVAMRDLITTSSLPAKLKCKAQGGLVVRQGDVLAFSCARLNIVKMPVRVLEIDRGTPTDGSLTLTCMHDVLGLPTDTYVVAQPTLWTAPNLTPTAVPAQALTESTYRDLAARMTSAGLAALDATTGYVGALGARPPCVAYSYDLATRIGSSGAFTVNASGAFAPTALLVGAMTQEAGPTVVNLVSGSDLDQVTLGSEVVIDDEILRVDALDTVALTATLARGCVDTAPAEHAAGARVWFSDGFTGTDPTEYLTGEVIQAKLLTRTGNGTLAQSLATTVSATLAQRQARPYPPAKLLVNGAAYPASVTAPLSLGWVERNRLTQADQLVDTTTSTITPETDTTYTLRVYLDGVLDSTTTGIIATSATPSVSGAGSVRVEIDAVRDGLASHQPLSATFDYA